MEMEKNRGKCLVIETTYEEEEEEDAFTRARLESLRLDARRELNERQLDEFRSKLAERIRARKIVEMSRETSKSRVSATRKAYSALERESLRQNPILDGPKLDHDRNQVEVKVDPKSYDLTPSINIQSKCCVNIPSSQKSSNVKPVKPKLPAKKKSSKISPEMKTLRELIKQNQNRLEEIPPICQCRQNWKIEGKMEKCANNCGFYNNQKGSFTGTKYIKIYDYKLLSYFNSFKITSTF